MLEESYLSYIYVCYQKYLIYLCMLLLTTFLIQFKLLWKSYANIIQFCVFFIKEMKFYELNNNALIA